MKSRYSLKHWGIGAIAILVLAASTAQAGPSSCPMDRGASSSGLGAEAAFIPTPMFQERMRLIEQALREGRLSPYDAGRLMRQQWELARFQQGFLAGAEPARASGGCGLINPELAAKLAPLGDMAINGMQSAGSLMRTLMRETERLIQDQAAADKAPL